MPKRVHDVLTPFQVKNAPPGRYVDGDGLHLLVRAGGSRSWVYRYMVQGKSRDLGLGSAGPNGLSLQQARAARNRLRLQLTSGRDRLQNVRDRSTPRTSSSAGVPSQDLVDAPARVLRKPRETHAASG